MKTKAKGFNPEGDLQYCKKFLKDKLAKKKCRGISNVCVLKCTCLSFFGLDEKKSLVVSVSRYMVDWAALTGKEKNQIL